MHIGLATVNDCSTTASFSVLGFDNDELFEWTNPRRREYPDHFRYYFLRRHQTRCWSPEHVFHVAVTDEQDEDWSGASQVVGYAVWQRRGESDVAKSWRMQAWWSRLELLLLGWRDWYHDIIKADKSVDYVRRKKWFASSNEDFDDIQEMWKLQNLSVDPAFQRRGVGGMLIDWGQKQATLEGCPVALTASRVGQELYRKKGFRAYGHVSCEGFEDIPMFVWEPEGMEGWWGTKNDGSIKGKPQEMHYEDAF